MDIDRALFDRASKDDFRLLRVYRFSGNSVTVGRTFRGTLPEEWLRTSPEVAVRPTGGGAVWHRNDLCFSFIASPRPPVSLREFYRLFHGWLNRFLETRSVRAVCLSPNASASHTGGRGLCFFDPVPGDLLMSGQKILGGALRISGGRILYQGSLSIPDSPPDLLADGFGEWYEEEGCRMLANDVFPAWGPGPECPGERPGSAKGVNDV